MRLRSVLLAAMGFLFAASSVPAMAADDPDYLVVGAGAWQVLRDPKPEFDIAYRSGYKLWIFKPHAGLMVAGDGDYYGYAGLLTDIYWGRHLVTTLSAAIGGYGGGGYDLGSHFEFRTGGEIAWRFDNAMRVGVGLYHISNAGITERNPGGESAIMTVSLPLRSLFGPASSATSSRGTPKAAVAGFSQVGPSPSRQ